MSDGKKVVYATLDEVDEVLDALLSQCDCVPTPHGQYSGVEDESLCVCNGVGVLRWRREDESARRVALMPEAEIVALVLVEYLNEESDAKQQTLWNWLVHRDVFKRDLAASARKEDTRLLRDLYGEVLDAAIQRRRETIDRGGW